MQYVYLGINEGIILGSFVTLQAWFNSFDILKLLITYKLFPYFGLVWSRPSQLREVYF